MLEEVAAALSLTSEELQAELAGGRTLAAIAEEQGVAGDEFTQLLKDAWTKALGAAVADGVLTQEQADWLADHPLLARFAGGRIHRPRGRGAMGWGTFGQGWLNDDAGLAEGTVNG
jgi:hypothetical protein